MCKLNMESHTDKDPIIHVSNGGYTYSNQKCSLNLMFATAVVVIGSSFQFGYNTGVINEPEAVIEQFVNDTSYERHGEYMGNAQIKLLWGVIVSIFAVGGMFGSFAAGYTADRFGRKKSLFFNNLVAILGVILMSCSKTARSYELLAVGRFIIGFNAGMNTGLAPLYLTEIAPVHLRGVLGTLNQMGIVTSMLISQILGLPQILGNDSAWPWLLCVPAIFAAFQIATLPFCPDSPAYQLSISNKAEAKKSLQWLRGTLDVDQEMQSLEIQQSESSLEEKVGIVKIFKTSFLLRPMIIAIVMQCSQQLSGINAVFYYSTDIFKAAGVSAQNSTYVTVGMGCANVIMSGVSVALIEKAGRRTLHLVGLGGMFFCAVILIFSLDFSYLAQGLTYVSIIAVIVFVVFFQVGPGSIPWFITAELFRENARPAAISVAGLVNWSGNFLVGIAYPSLQLLIHGYTFVIFAVFIALFWLFTFKKVPETKGRSINEIVQLFEI